MTWQNVNVHAPDADQGFLSKIFKKNGADDSRKHIIQNGKFNELKLTEIMC